MSTTIDEITVRLIAHEVLILRLIGTFALGEESPGRFLAAIQETSRKDVFKTLGMLGTLSEEDRQMIFAQITHLLGQINIKPKRSTN